MIDFLGNYGGVIGGLIILSLVIYEIVRCKIRVRNEVKYHECQWEVSSEEKNN